MIGRGPWPSSTLRVLAFELDAPGATPPITGVGRVDVHTDPIFGVGLGHPMSARYNPGVPAGTDASCPFVGRRLERAVLAPRPADALVVAHPADCILVSDDIRRSTPWIVAFRAAERLWPVVPSAMMRVSWTHGDDRWLPEPATAAGEASFIARLTMLMLRVVPPGELVWLSRAGK